MYLLVIVTVVIGILGLYAQILSLQAARIAESRFGLAAAMSTWHSAAVSMGGSIVDTGQFPPGSVACSLTYDIPPPPFGGSTMSWCPAPTGTGDAYGTVTSSNVPGALPSCPFNYIYNKKAGDKECVHLPADFQIAQYQFYSVLYLDANGQAYVVTFVPSPTPSSTNPAPGFLSLPPNLGTYTSFTMSDLIHQLQVSGLAPYSFGPVASTATTSTLMSGGLMTGSFQYSMPLFGGKPVLNNGAVAIVSATAGF